MSAVYAELDGLEGALTLAEVTGSRVYKLDPLPFPYQINSIICVIKF